MNCGKSMKSVSGPEYIDDDDVAMTDDVSSDYTYSFIGSSNSLFLNLMNP